MPDYGHDRYRQSKNIATKKTTPSWTDVKAALADFDRASLLGLMQDLYADSKDDQAFQLARLDAVPHIGRNFGYGEGDDMDFFLAKSGFDGRSG